MALAFLSNTLTVIMQGPYNGISAKDKNITY